MAQKPCAAGERRRRKLAYRCLGIAGMARRACAGTTMRGIAQRGTLWQALRRARGANEHRRLLGKNAWLVA